MTKECKNCNTPLNKEDYPTSWFMVKYCKDDKCVKDRHAKYTKTHGKPKKKQPCVVCQGEITEKDRNIYCSQKCIDKVYRNKR